MRWRSLAAVAILSLGGCAHTHRFCEEMTWSERGGALQLAFVSAPDTHLVVTGAPELLDHLRRRVTDAVSVDFEVHCDFGRKVDWFSVVSVEGFPFPARAWGGLEEVGAHVEAGPFAGTCR